MGRVSGFFAASSETLKTASVIDGPFRSCGNCGSCREALLVDQVEPVTVQCGLVLLIRICLRS